MEDVKQFLSDELVTSAFRLKDDYAWRKNELLYVAAAAERQNVASGGWQALFRTPDGDCELYWYSFFPEAIKHDELWPEFVYRSWEESRKLWRKLFEDEELIEEGRKAFRLFQQTELPGLLPRDCQVRPLFQ